MEEKLVYIGDSVYMKTHIYGVEIFTNNGLGKENIIVLEPEVIHSLLKELGRMGFKQKDPYEGTLDGFLNLES